MQILKKVQIILLAVLLVNCNDDDSNEPSNIDLAQNKLGGSWTLTYAQLDADDITSGFQNFTLTIDNLNYSTNSDLIDRQPNPWPKTGLFILPGVIDNTTNFALTRDDNVTLNVNFLADNSMRITFFYDSSTAGGRQNAVDGEWVFEFTK